MFGTSSVDATTIVDVEVSTFFSCSLYELIILLVKYIIYPTAKSITPFAHSIPRRHDQEG